MLECLLIYLSNCAVHHHHYVAFHYHTISLGVTNVFLHSWDVCGVACSGALILDFLSKLAGWVRFDGKYVKSRLGGVVFGVRAK